MTDRPNFQLACLREIGWSKWNPIGVRGPEHGWPADEYDAYLLHAADQLWNGQSDEEVADYLIRIETENMGLAAAPGIRQRASDVVRSMRPYAETLRR